MKILSLLNLTTVLIYYLFIYFQNSRFDNIVDVLSFPKSISVFFFNLFYFHFFDAVKLVNYVLQMIIVKMY